MTPPAIEPRRLLDDGALGPDERAAAGLLARLPEPEIGVLGLAQERIWRELAADLPMAPGRLERRPRLLLALAPALALGVACLAVIFWWARSPGPVAARLELTAGQVLAASPRRAFHAATAGAALPEATRLRTDGRGRALLALAGASVVVSPGTDLALESLGRSTFLRLSGGEVVAQVKPRRPGEPFVVQTTRYRVTVKGTIFAVRERAPDDVSVSVSRGLVEVTEVGEGEGPRAGAGGIYWVAAGHSWRSQAPGGEGTDDISGRDRRLLEEATGGGARAPIRVEGPSELEVSEGGLALGPPPVTWNVPAGRYHFVGTAPAGRAEGDASTSGGAATVRLAFASPPTLHREGGQASGKASPIAGARPGLRQSPDRHPSFATGSLSPTRVSKEIPRGEASRDDDTLDDSAEVLRARPVVGTREALNGRPSSAPVVPGGVASPPRPLPALPRQAPLSLPMPPVVGLDAKAVPSHPPASPAPPSPVVPSEPSPPLASQGEQGGPPPPPPTAPPDPYAAVVSLSRGGRYVEAARALQVIASGAGPHAALALYDLGRLRQRELGDPEGALRAYLRYERDYPHGSLSQEVELSAIEIALQRPDPTAALSQMDRFLDEHPDGERAPKVHLLRGNLYRGKGDLRRALRDYGRAKGPGVEDDGLYFTAWCQQQLGDAGDAADSLRDYRRRFPHGSHAREVEAALRGR